VSPKQSEQQLNFYPLNWRAQMKIGDRIGIKRGGYPVIGTVRAIVENTPIITVTGDIPHHVMGIDTIYDVRQITGGTGYGKG
jgi:hypothetical protein